MTFTADRLLLFGATGDLAQRKLLPSLAALDADDLLAPDLRIIASARRNLSDDGYRQFAREAVEEHLPEDRQGELDRFLQRLHYEPVDATEITGFDALTRRIGTGAGLAIFLSTAPGLFKPTIEGLKHAGLTDDRTRIGLEKPLGSDLESSRAINDAVATAFPEERIFRIDHYLGKETVQNLLALRFANILFEPIWNASYIEHVQITVAETIGIEGREDFYDEAGALRDMVQNHILQLLTLVAMEPPTSYDAGSVRDEKVKVLRALRPTAPGESVIGQYEASTIGGQAVPSYAEELGKRGQTESFVALRTHIDNWRWAGVPFYLRTGKRLAERVAEIMVQFRCIPHSMFGEASVSPNRLVIGIQPEENITLCLMAREPGLDRQGVSLRTIPLDIALPDAFSGKIHRIAYERLLLDLIEGNQALFVRRDEVEAQWRWIDQVRARWNEEGLEPAPYPAGSWGPAAAMTLIERDGVKWHD